MTYQLDKKKQKEHERNFNREIDIALSHTMERFAEASAEHIQSYTDLAKISKSKVHPDYERINKQQQAGFSAEVKEVARVNAENSIGGKSERIHRTNDNNPEADIISTTGQKYQQKNFFTEKNYRKLYNDENYDKYKGTDIKVPKDQYDAIRQDNREQISKLEQQIESQKIKNPDKIQSIKNKIQKIKDVDSRLVDSKTSTDDAMFAREHPILSTIGDTVSVAHRAGMEGAKGGAMIGGAVSAVRNIKALGDGTKDIDEALFDTGKDTLISTATSYGKASGASVVGGMLKSSHNNILKSLAKKPIVLVECGLILTKETFSLITGKITPEQFVKNIGKQGHILATTLCGSTVGAAIGTVIIPIPVVGSIVGGFIGGTVASMISASWYGQLTQALQSRDIARERRKRIEAICAAIKAEEIKYREEMLTVFNAFFKEKEKAIRTGFEEISHALETGQSISSGLTHIAKAYNIELPFASKEALFQHIQEGKTLQI